MTKHKTGKRSAADIRALADGWRERRWLDAETEKVRAVVAEWMAEQRAAADVAGSTYVAPVLHDPDNRSAGDRPLGEAVRLLMDGYCLEHVCRRTGWGGWWLKNSVGPDGYFRPLTDERREVA